MLGFAEPNESAFQTATDGLSSESWTPGASETAQPITQEASDASSVASSSRTSFRTSQPQTDPEVLSTVSTVRSSRQSRSSVSTVSFSDTEVRSDVDSRPANPTAVSEATLVSDSTGQFAVPLEIRDELTTPYPFVASKPPIRSEVSSTGSTSVPIRSTSIAKISVNQTSQESDFASAVSSPVTVSESEPPIKRPKYDDVGIRRTDLPFEVYSKPWIPRVPNFDQKDKDYWMTTDHPYPDKNRPRKPYPPNRKKPEGYWTRENNRPKFVSLKPVRVREPISHGGRSLRKRLSNGRVWNRRRDRIKRLGRLSRPAFLAGAKPLSIASHPGMLPNSRTGLSSFSLRQMCMERSFSCRSGVYFAFDRRRSMIDFIFMRDFLSRLCARSAAATAHVIKAQFEFSQRISEQGSRTKLSLLRCIKTWLTEKVQVDGPPPYSPELCSIILALGCLYGGEKAQTVPTYVAAYKRRAWSHNLHPVMWLQRALELQCREGDAQELRREALRLAYMLWLDQTSKPGQTPSPQGESAVSKSMFSWRSMSRVAPAATPVLVAEKRSVSSPMAFETPSPMAFETPSPMAFETPSPKANHDLGDRAVDLLREAMEGAGLARDLESEVFSASIRGRHRTPFTQRSTSRPQDSHGRVLDILSVVLGSPTNHVLEAIRGVMVPNPLYASDVPHIPENLIIPKEIRAVRSNSGLRYKYVESMFHKLTGFVFMPRTDKVPRPQSLSYETLLGFLALGLQNMRLPITPEDIARWTRSGDLPLMLEVLPEWLLQQTKARTSPRLSAFGPRTYLTGSHIAESAASLVSLGLTVAPFNSRAYVPRLINLLGLPVQLTSYAYPALNFIEAQLNPNEEDSAIRRETLLGDLDPDDLIQRLCGGCPVWSLREAYGTLPCMPLPGPIAVAVAVIMAARALYSGFSSDPGIFEGDGIRSFDTTAQPPDVHWWQLEDLGRLEHADYGREREAAKRKVDAAERAASKGGLFQVFKYKIHFRIDSQVWVLDRESLGDSIGLVMLDLLHEHATDLLDRLKDIGGTSHVSEELGRELGLSLDSCQRLPLPLWLSLRKERADFPSMHSVPSQLAATRALLQRDNHPDLLALSATSMQSEFLGRQVQLIDGVVLRSCVPTALYRADDAINEHRPQLLFDVAAHLRSGCADRSVESDVAAGLAGPADASCFQLPPSHLAGGVPGRHLVVPITGLHGVPFLLNALVADVESISGVGRSGCLHLTAWLEAELMSEGMPQWIRHVTTRRKAEASEGVAGLSPNVA